MKDSIFIWKRYLRGRYPLTGMGIVLLFLLSAMPCMGQAWEPRDTLLFMFWNLENFFDYTDSGQNDSDREFSSFGGRRWTKGRFYAKCNAVAKTLLWIESEYGRIPDVAGLAEVENRHVLNSLLGSTSLRKYDYGIVHYESPDNRGIDVALIYRKSVFRKIRSRPVPVGMGSSGNGFRTRDILYAALELCVDGCREGREDAAVFHFLVNHHPSKFGGAKASAPKRRAAMDVMMGICDSVFAAGGSRIISMGDFNDTPDSPLFAFEGTGMVNLALPLAMAGEGTIRYRGKWDLIDMFIVSDILSAMSGMEVCRVPFLTVWDNAFAGEKPFRTYSGPRYIGGVSDHFPVLMKIVLPMINKQ